MSLRRPCLPRRPPRLAAWFLVAAGGCSAAGDDTAPAGSGDSSGDTSQTDTADTGETDTADSVPAGTLVLDDANNYAYVSSTTIAVQATHEGEDAKVDWSRLTEDLVGHPIDPTTDVNLLGLAVLPHLTPAEATEKLSAGLLVQEDIAVVYTLNSRGATNARLSEFRDLTTNFDPPTDFLAEAGAFLLVAQPISRPGAATLTFIDPQAGVPASDIVLDDDTADVAFQATIPPALSVPTTGPWGVEWVGLTTGGGGQPIAYTPIDGLWIARYDSLDASDFAAHFFDLEPEADGLWKLAISAVDSVDDLTAATAADGSPFPGFSAGSSWAIALRCGSCVIAAPPYFAALEPTP